MNPWLKVLVAAVLDVPMWVVGLQGFRRSRSTKLPDSASGRALIGAVIGVGVVVLLLVRAVGG